MCSITAGPMPGKRAGGRYYPKMQVAAPFSPVTGPRLLAGTGPDSDDARLTLLRALETVCQKLEVSSVHVTFCTEREHQIMGIADWIPRVGRQFHWHNRGYETFDDFLGALTSRKRKMIRKERRQVCRSGHPRPSAHRRRHPTRTLGRLLSILRRYL